MRQFRNLNKMYAVYMIGDINLRWTCFFILINGQSSHIHFTI